MKKLVFFGVVACVICPGLEVQAATLCPQIFKPVCGDRDGSFRTYTNACFAHAARARVIANCPCATGK